MRIWRAGKEIARHRLDAFLEFPGALVNPPGPPEGPCGAITRWLESVEPWGEVLELSTVEGSTFEIEAASGRIRRTLRVF
jgi:hypothetical protein